MSAAAKRDAKHQKQFDSSRAVNNSANMVWRDGGHVTGDTTQSWLEGVALGGGWCSGHEAEGPPIVSYITAPVWWERQAP